MKVRIVHDHLVRALERLGKVLDGEDQLEPETLTSGEWTKLCNVVVTLEQIESRVYRRKRKEATK